MADEGIPQAVLDRIINAPQNIAHFGSIPYKSYVDNQPVGEKLKEAFRHFLGTPEGQQIVAGAPGGRGVTRTATAPAQPAAPARAEPSGGPGIGQPAQIPTYDDLGTYARASQLAQLTGVPAFSFQGKLYRPGDTQTPVQPTPKVPNATTSFAGEHGSAAAAVPMDRRPESETAPAALPRPASQGYNAGPDFNIRGGGNA